MKEKLLIIGASGHGKVVADLAIKMNQWQSIAFLGDESVEKCMGLEVIGKTEDTWKYKDEADFFVGIGDNGTREKIQKKLISKGLSVATLIHPNAIIGTEVSIGIGSVIMAGVVINSSTIVRKGCIVNTSSSLDHDNFIDDYVHISPGVRTAGTVKIGKSSWIGIGTVVSNNISICGNCKIGAGSVVVKDIDKSGTYFGSPVRSVI